MLSLQKPLFFSRHDPLIGFLLLGLTGLYFIFFTLANYLNHDVSWILYSAREMLSGAEFGRDVVDVNPPLAWWLSKPPAFVATVFDWSAALVFKIYVLLLMALSLGLLRRALPSLLFWQIGALAAILVITPGYHFGQREHLMMIFVLPYLATLMNSEQGAGKPLSFSIGLLAGLGICLKPYFLLIPLVCELYRLSRTRRIEDVLRVEVMAMFLVGLAYLAAIWFLAPAYVFDVLPGAFSNYGAYKNPLASVLKVIVISSLPVLIAWLLLQFSGAGDRQVGFLVAAIGAALAALVQSKGWSYHLLPILGFLLMGFVFALNRVKAGIGGFAALLIAVLMLSKNTLNYLPQMGQQGQEQTIHQLALLMRSMPAPHRVFAFITSPRIIHSAVLASGAQWSGVACCVHTLPAAVRYKTKDTQIQSAAQLDDIFTRLEKERPGLIIVDGAKNKLGFGGQKFDYLGYLNNTARYARFLHLYKERPLIGSFRIFERK